MISETAKKMPCKVWLRRVGALFLMLTYILLSISLMQVSVVPDKYLIPAIPVYGAAVAAIVWLLIVTKKPHKKSTIIIAICAAIILSVANITAYTMVRATGDLLSGLQASKVEYIDYVIIAKKDDNVQVATAANVGTISNDPLYTQASEALAQETPATQQPYATLTNLTQGMDAGEVVLGSMRQASLQLLSENYPDFYQSIVMLATYQVKSDGQSAKTNVTQPFVLYISGIDTYGEVATVSRSDVNMLAVVNPQTHKILLVNTPRDYYVQLHGTTGAKDKLTHAGLYGIDMSRQTLEDLYSTQISAYLRVNFDSLVEVIDALGGVDVYSDYDFLTFHTGNNRVDGKQALTFARERHSFNEGDRQRGKNQQRVIEAIVAKLNNPRNLLNYQAIMKAVKGAVQTNLSEGDLTKLINQQLDTMKAWSTESIAVDGTGAMNATYSMGNQQLYVMIPDQATVDAAKQKIADTLNGRN